MRTRPASLSYQQYKILPTQLLQGWKYYSGGLSIQVMTFFTFLFNLWDIQSSTSTMAYKITFKSNSEMLFRFWNKTKFTLSAKITSDKILLILILEYKIKISQPILTSQLGISHARRKKFYKYHFFISTDWMSWVQE